MTFVSFSFLAFLPIVFALYWLLSKSLRWQNLFLVAASYVFYGWWDWRFLALILVTSLSSYCSGVLLERTACLSRRKMVVTANIVLNVGILAFFKYFNFFADSLQTAVAAVGLRFDAPTLDIVLPVGISFYTFQSLSYTIDVFRHKIPPTRQPIAFLAYISFFPQLVAGPIERATDLLPQMLQRRRFAYDAAVDGLRQMLWGFFKKMVVADTCAITVNQVWADWQHADATALVLGMLLFTFQIYCDFSGYSDIAIGTARLFGIRLSANFRLPYFSRSVAEFWRRWHISLMTWFRDYVYIPLGGSRGALLATVRNTFVVFLFSGLWHGANWTFVAWGGYNACLLVLPLLLRRRRTSDSASPQLADLPAMLLTFLLVAVGWVVFRAPTLAAAVGYVSTVVQQVLALHFGPLALGKSALLWCAVLLLVEWVQRDRPHVLSLTPEGVFRFPLVRWLLYYAVTLSIVFFHGEQQTFIYFQF